MMNQQLIRKYLNGSLTAEEQLLFDAYLAEGDLALLQEVMEQEWFHNEKLDVSIDSTLSDEILKQINSNIKTPKVVVMAPRRIFGAVAASIAFIVLLSLYFLFKPASKVQPIVQAFENDTDSILPIELEDGSSVILNTNSSLLFSMDDQNRSVELEGEAYFDVYENPDLPFTVESAGIYTTALGTSFNIKAFEESKRVEVSLISGKVEVDLSKQNQVLTPNQQLVYSKLTNDFETKAFNLKDVNDWRNELMIFEQMPLSEVLLDFSRFFDVEINTEKIGYHSCLISSSFSKENSVEEVLTVLLFLHDLGFEKIGDTYVISGKNCK